MKKYILITFFFALNIFNYVNAQTWLWAESAGGPNNFVDNAEYICTDNNGNIYVAGMITLPICYFHTDTFTINGFNDFFLAKYDTNGNELWAKQFGGYNSITANPIKTEDACGLIFDANTNSVYMSGVFVGSCVFGTYTLNANGSNDGQMFIAKFDLNGNCIWAKSGGGSGDDGFGALTVDQNGSIYVLGGTQYGATIDTISLPPCGFIAKYDDNGSCIWAKKIFEPGTAGGQSIKIYNSDILILGINLADSFYVDTMLIQTNNYKGYFVARFDSTGNILQVNKYIGGPSATGHDDMSLDVNGNCYLIGSFKNGYATFNNNIDTIYSSDTTHFFLTKYDVYGNFKWVQQDSASVAATGSDIFTDADSNTYITGSFSGSAHFGSFDVTASASQDMFVAKYNTTGDCLGVNTAGEAFGYGVTADASGSCYVTGGFRNTINFGSTILTSHGGSDIFVAKSDMITGINEKKQNTNNHLIIYANPTTGKCNITVPDDFYNEKNLTLTIFDNSGKLIQQKTLEMSEGKIKLDLEQEAKGVYNVTLSNGKKVYSGKIVFE